MSSIRIFVHEKQMWKTSDSIPSRKAEANSSKLQNEVDNIGSNKTTVNIFYLSCSWVRWHRTNLEWQVLRRKEDWIQFLPADRGIEPGIAGWKAQMLPLCYAVPPKNCHWKFYLEEFLKDHRHLSLEVLYIKFEFDVLFLPLLYPLVKMYVKT